jgi:hypothetical protein
MISKQTFQRGLTACMVILVILIAYIQLDKYDVLTVGDLFEPPVTEGVFNLDHVIHFRTRDGVTLSITPTIRIRYNIYTMDRVTRYGAEQHRDDIESYITNTFVKPEIYKVVHDYGYKHIIGSNPFSIDSLHFNISKFRREIGDDLSDIKLENGIVIQQVVIGQPIKLDARFNERIERARNAEKNLK